MNNLDLQKQIEQTVQNYIADAISKINIKEVIAQTVRTELQQKLNNFDFPKESINASAINWQKGSLNGSFINGGMIENFSSVGIDDKAKSVQLTILDNHVVVENEFTALNVTAAEDINAKNISLTGTLEFGTEIIDHGALTQFVQLHANIVACEQLQKFHLLPIEETPLVTENALASTVITSNLRRVGNLQELNVIGDAKFSETLFVGTNGRIGINTDSPRGVLTVSDQDAEFTVVRSNKRTMFIGTTNNNNNLEIGTNNTGQISISPDIIGINSPVSLLGIKFSTQLNIPEHIGEPNELVFVTNAREGQPILYICRGSNKWLPIARI